MDTQSREAAEAFVEKVAASRLAVQERPSARARAEAIREDAELVRRELLAQGVDLAPLSVLAEERGKARLQRTQQSHGRAVEASAAAAARLAALTPALTTLPAEPMNVIVDRVTFIRSFIDAGVVLDSEIESLNSWARYRLEASRNFDTMGAGRLSFFTLWRNPQNKAVVVAAGARLVVNAHLSVDAPWRGVAAWAGISGGADARATVRGRTTVWAMWDSSIKAVVHDRILGEAAAKGGFFGEDDEITIEFNEFLSASGFVVPARESILIEVELLTNWFLDGGAVDLDAESGSFQVSVPHLILTLT